MEHWMWQCDLVKRGYILFQARPLLAANASNEYIAFHILLVTQAGVSISLFILNERVSSQVKHWAMQQMCTKHPCDNGQGSH